MRRPSLPNRLPNQGHTGARAPQRGVSLIEMMISLVLGMLVVVVASMVFLGTRQANRSTEALGRMQETARNAFELMARELRETGGTPCDSTVVTTNVLRTAQTVPPSWFADWTNPLMGYEGVAAFAGMAVGADVGERVSGTDAVSVKYVSDLTDLTVVSHDTANAVFTVNRNPHRVVQGDLLMACTYRQAAVFQASAVTPDTVAHVDSVDGNCSKGLGLGTDCSPVGVPYMFTAGSKIGRLRSVGWYIGNNGRADTGGRSLYRVSQDGAEEVAEGVRDMQIEYLVGGAAAYVAADAVPAANWSAVVGMRISLMLSSPQVGVSTAPGSRLDRPMVFTLSLRNRLS